MERRARVLVVDDSVVIRRLIARVVDGQHDMTVCASAPNGAIALSKIDQLRPDIVTLDIEMPVLDGLQTLARIREAHPTLPVIMCSTLTERGAAATLEALSLGATDYVTKPSSTSGASLDAALDRLAAELVPRIRALCPRVAEPLPAPTAPRPPATATRPSTPPSRVHAVVIGVSTGGPSALAELVPALPGDLGVPVLICQHMPPVFTRLLAERLDAKSPLRVVEASDGDQVRAGGVWLAPGGLHMLVRKVAATVVVRTTADPPENSCRPAVDPLLRSAVETWGAGVLAVILTGMGQDGLRGCEAVVAAGGRVVAQDEATSVVWGMPGYVTRGGLADRVLPLAALPAEIARRVGAPSLTTAKVEA